VRGAITHRFDMENDPFLFSGQITKMYNLVKKHAGLKGCPAEPFNRMQNITTVLSMSVDALYCCHARECFTWQNRPDQEGWKLAFYMDIKSREVTKTTETSTPLILLSPSAMSNTYSVSLRTYRGLIKTHVSVLLAVKHLVLLPSRIKCLAREVEK